MSWTFFLAKETGSMIRIDGKMSGAQYRLSLDKKKKICCCLSKSFNWEGSLTFTKNNDQQHTTKATLE